MLRGPYVGIINGTGRREVFECTFVPTMETHGTLYAAVIGPFETMRGARFMAEHGAANPHVQCVADAERIAGRE